MAAFKRLSDAAEQAKRQHIAGFPTMLYLRPDGVAITMTWHGDRKTIKVVSWVEISCAVENPIINAMVDMAAAVMESPDIVGMVKQ